MDCMESEGDCGYSPMPKINPSFVTATPFNFPASFGILTHFASRLSR